MPTSRPLLSSNQTPSRHNPGVGITAAPPRPPVCDPGGFRPPLTGQQWHRRHAAGWRRGWRDTRQETGSVMTTVPSRYDGVTIACPICGLVVPATGRRRFCSPGCRQKAWRRRQQPAVSNWTPPAGSSLKASTVYECPACEARLLGQQRCPDCQLWARRLGPGAPCPHCDELVTLADLGLTPPTGGTTVMA